MKATIVWEVDKRLRKDGTYPLRWRLTYNGERRYYQSDTVITPKDINKKFEITDWDVEERLLDDLRVFRRRIRELHLDINLLDMDYVFQKVFGTVNPHQLEFVQWANKWITETSKKRESVASRYKPALNAFIRYKGNKIPLSEMTSKTMKGFENYLVNNGGKRTPSLYTMCIKAMFNAMRDEYNDYDNEEIVIKNTMASYKPPQPPVAEKRGMTLEQMRLILNSPEHTGNTLRDMARDLFIISFHLLGTNAVDLWQLKKWENGKICYERQKTRERRADNAYIEIDVPEEVIPLMNKYKAKSGEYVFTFHSRFKCHNNFTKAINEGLKILAAEINGIDHMKLYYRSVRERVKIKHLLQEEYHHIPTPKIPADLDYYTARHTMATIAVNDVLIDKYTVDMMLNHSSQLMADRYVRDNFRPINIANKKLLDFVYGRTEAEQSTCKTIAI